MGNFIDGFREFFADPIGVLEGMGQKTMDRYEEEGLCYAAGYLSIDAGLTVCGGLKGLKSLTSLKFVDNATDTAQLAKHMENVMDIVDDTTDMAKIVENGNDVADSALDVGKVAEGGLEPGTLSNVDARKWYLEQEAKIPDLIDNSLPLEQQARQAFDLRNQYRTQARELMSDRQLAESLYATDPNLTWEQIVQKQIDKGLSGDDNYKAIIESSQRSRTSVNQSLGLE